MAWLLTRNNLFRFVTVALLSVGLCFSIPVSQKFLPPIVYLFLTGIALGISLLRTPTVPPELKERVPIAAMPVLIWGAMSTTVLLSGHWLYPEMGVRLFSFNLFKMVIAVRSLLDIAILVLILLLVGGFILATRKETRMLRNTVVIVVALFVALIAWLVKIGSRKYIYLWAPDQLSEELRFLLLFDLCNAIWLGAIVPVWFVKEINEDRVNLFLSNSLGSYGRRIPYLLLVLLPVPIAFLVSAMAWGTLDIVDSLGPEWWLRKSLSILFWTAVYEETVYRLSVFVAFDSFETSAERSNSRTLVAALATSMLYSALHLNLGFVAAGTSLFLSAIFILVLFRSRSIELCILGHAVFDIILIRWNTGTL